MTDKPITEKSLTIIVEKVVINALHDFYEGVLEPKFNTLATKEELKQLSKVVDDNTYQIKQLKTSVDDLKADLSDTPTRAESERRLKN